ncbi:carotenoid oxygenase family protein [Streptomyces sp. NPDC060205]|uniref:carotenoid oxygenase family protein n=1 Tax=Streptomyces sp. NPDC060205 TaxID=3347072 RepID=UPI00365A1092
MLDSATSTATEESLDDVATDFPTINQAYTGRLSRISYSVAFPGAGLEEFAIVKLDTATGKRLGHRPGPHRHAGEAVFVPADGATREDDGYLLTIVSDLRADASQLLVLDAQDLTSVAEVHLPRRGPSGIHGSWIAADRLTE